MKVIVWGDYICPWSYLGLAIADHLIRTYDADVTWLPYEVHPETPVGGTPVARWFGGREQEWHAYLSQLAHRAHEAGLPLNPPTHVPNTQRALQAGEWVRRNASASFPRFHASLYNAHWGTGGNIEHAGVIDELATSAGIDTASLHEALSSGEAAEFVVGARRAAEAASVKGTPTWLVNGRVRIVGAKSRSDFEEILARNALSG